MTNHTLTSINPKTLVYSNNILRILVVTLITILIHTIVGVCRMVYVAWRIDAPFYWCMSFAVCLMVYDVCLGHFYVLFSYILFQFWLDWISFTCCLLHLILFLYSSVLYIDSGKLDSFLTSLWFVSVSIPPYNLEFVKNRPDSIFVIL